MLLARSPWYVSIQTTRACKQCSCTTGSIAGGLWGQLFCRGMQTLTSGRLEAAPGSLMCLALPWTSNPMQRPYPLVCDRAGTATIDGTAELLGEMASAMVPPGFGLSSSQCSWASSRPPPPHSGEVCLVHFTLPHLHRLCNMLILSTGLFLGLPSKAALESKSFRAETRVKVLHSTPVSTTMPQDSKNLQFKNGAFHAKGTASLPPKQK